MMRDEEIMRRVQDGDRNAFERLVERYKKRLYGFCYSIVLHREDAEDCVQESFLKAYRHAKTFHPSKSFRTWLYTIARNTCLDFRRSETRQPAEPTNPETVTSLVRGLASQEDDSQWIHTVISIRLCLSELNEEERMVFWLIYAEGCTEREVGRMPEMSHAKARRIHANVKKKMKACLTRRGVR